ncbi:MAG: DUF1573 domain-containing protein [Tannerella sp.]|jgi:hypothetical protein|nr:DUF1573 domain-containing protein [Tannerella sp.]
MRKTAQVVALVLFGWFLPGQPVCSQDGKTETEGAPVATLPESTHDFGLIEEEAGFASHVFQVRNTGDAPLLITHVQSSCGCTEPQWTREPIAPGKTGVVEITFDPTNRPGPFRKNVTVFTNDKKPRLRLTIQGDVVPRRANLQHAFHDTIGTVQMERKAFLFYTVRPGAEIRQEIWIRNFSNEDVTLSFDDVPEYIRLETPELLKSGKTERFRITLEASKLPPDKRGHMLGHVTWKGVSASGATVRQSVPLSMNFVDDFSTLTAEEKANAPTIRLSNTVTDFGQLEKGGFFSRRKKTVSRQIIITNEGKSDLTFHSVGSDDERVRVAIAKKTLRAGESIAMNVILSPKTVEGRLAAEVYLVCNDPRGPVRNIRVAAEGYR